MVNIWVSLTGYSALRFLKVQLTIESKVEMFPHGDFNVPYIHLTSKITVT